MRRTAPRSLARVLADRTSKAAPPTLLARVQSVWDVVVGPAVAQQAEPVGERDGTVEIACRSSVWAQEIDLLGPELRREINERLGSGEPVVGLRARVGRPR